MVRRDGMLFSLLLALHAHDALAGEGPPPAGLAAAWGSSPPATWIVGLETTGPLKKVAESAREPIARLVEALPAGDRVEIVALHTRSSPVLPRRTVDEAGRAALAQEIRSLELPSAKSSDLGAGLTALAASVDGAPDDGPRMVLFMGSFCHSPPLGSIWADGGYGCRAIRSFDKLQQLYDEGKGHDLVAVRLFPVTTPEQAAHDGGVESIRAFFEPKGSVQVVTEPFAQWLDVLRTRSADERLAPLARAEAGKLALTAEVVKQPSDTEPTAEIQLSTGLRRLAFEATTVTVEGARAPAGPIRLDPTGTLTLEVDVPEPSFSLVPRTDEVDMPVRVRIDGVLAPSDALQAAGVDPVRSGLTAEVTLRAARAYGLPPARSALMFASALLLSGAGVLVVRRKVTPLRLGGTFSWRRAGGPRHPLSIEHLAEAAIVVQPDGSLAVGRREDALLVLRVERPLWKTHATVEIRVPNAEINTHPVGTGRHEVVAGATSLQFRDYRLSWE